MTAPPRVFNIPSTRPFLPTLADALLDGELIPGFAPRNDPLALAGATVYLPTRRATRVFAETLLEALGTGATLLPRIVPLGDADEDALAFADEAGLPERPSPIPAAARRLVLSKIVRDFARLKEASGTPTFSTSQSAALQLADELARLFDDLTIAEIDPGKLDEAGFIPANLDRHWQDSLLFLKHVYPAWQEHLAGHRLADPVAWRDRVLGREAERLKTGGGPVVAAGSTGTIPAVRRLIAAVARRAEGAVVLPGLDRSLDEPSFALIEGEHGEPSPGHPQFGLKRLIEEIGVKREDVLPLGGAADSARETLLSEAFRPTATTEHWRERSGTFDRIAGGALEGFAVVVASDPREEALALAVALRGKLETPDAKAALVTPDRALARRVANELRRWNIEVDDSGGMTLADSEAGRLARLAIAAAADAFAPVPVIALLRHPLTALGSPSAIDALEIAVLRGPRPASGLGGLLRTLEDTHAQATSGALHRRDARLRLAAKDWALAVDLAGRITQAFEPLTAFAGGETVPFEKLIGAHRETLARLGADLERRDAADIRALALALDSFADAARWAAPLSLADYADAFPQLLAGEPPVRPPFDRTARIRILGPLEARLLETDLIVLGGLNEGTWPPETRSDAWLSRPMRRALGLDLPERRIGLAAHDFVQAASARDVIVSRARKENGVETVASRFLQRLAAVAPQDAWNAAEARGRRYIDLARVLEQTERADEIKRPEPRPPAEARPGRLSVTEIETLIRDPYSIYARHILRLEPLDEIDADPGAGDRGTILHEAFAEFTKAAPGALPANALDLLIAAGERAFARIEDFPELHAIWWPRFLRAAEWLVREEEQLREQTEHILSETNGAIEFDAGSRTFKLTARADRIDRRRDGSAAIVDYKSGTPPTAPQVLSGLAPQLALEAAILREGGFEGIPRGATVAEIGVIRVSGSQPAGEWCPIDVTRLRGKAAERAKALGIDNPDRLADVSFGLLRTLIRTFADPSTPYLSIPRPQWRGRFGNYDHLARIKEWSANEEGSE